MFHPLAFSAPLLTAFCTSVSRQMADKWTVMPAVRVVWVFKTFYNLKPVFFCHNDLEHKLFKLVTCDRIP